MSSQPCSAKTSTKVDWHAWASACRSRLVCPQARGSCRRPLYASNGWQWQRGYNRRLKLAHWRGCECEALESSSIRRKCASLWLLGLQRESLFNFPSEKQAKPRERYAQAQATGSRAGVRAATRQDPRQRPDSSAHKQHTRLDEQPQRWSLLSNTRHL
jgi:hypothetical protein